MAIIDSETLEEAPTSWRIWMGQRTRWIKGWIQTYLVHMRRPLRLWRDLGPRRFIGFQVTIGAMILSNLIHPWFYVLAAMHGTIGSQFMPADNVLWWICGFNLAAGYGAAGLMTATAASAGGRYRLLSVLWLPIYWLAISLAAYRAVLDLIFRPFYWEKTMHGTTTERSPLAR